VAAVAPTSEIVLDEMHRVLSAQLGSYQSLSERASTVLSVLTGFATAALTVEVSIARPPLWVVAIPSALILFALAFASRAFRADAVWIGPEAESLAKNLGESPDELRQGLVDFYVGVIADNRNSLTRRAQHVEVATWFLVFAIASLVLLGLALYL
jgi:hypothetical protein